MILRRLGNKNKIAKEIQKHFPPHKIYIEPFFGAGGMFFNKPKAKYNIVNDMDSDVFNLFQVVMNQKEELLNYLELMPYDQNLFEYWKINKEIEAIPKAARFLFLSNMSYLGKSDTMKIMFCTSLNSLMKNINGCNNFSRTKFSNLDFRKFLNAIEYKKDGRNDEKKTLIYNDPPYLGTGNNYNANNWNEKDALDLFSENIKLGERGAKFAISEFNNPFILDLAKQYNLEVITIGERQNLKNRRTEILIVNYESPALYGLFGSRNLCAV